jgi:hypothetical protein
MAVNADETFWGFLFWIKHNPYMSIEEMTWPDLHEMAKQFAAVNATACTLTAATALSHANEGFGVVDFSTDSIEFPLYATATRYATDGAGLDASTTLAANKLLCARSLYPQKLQYA